MTVTKIGDTGLSEATQLKLKRLSKSTKSEYDNGTELDRIINNEVAANSLKALDDSLQTFSEEINKKPLDARAEDE